MTLKCRYYCVFHGKETEKRSAEEEGRENGVTRTVVIPSARLGFRKFLALAEWNGSIDR